MACQILMQLNSLPAQTRVNAQEIAKNRMLFAGLLDDGSIDVWTADFHLKNGEFDIDLTRPKMDSFQSLAMGAEAATEIIKHETPRSKLEFHRWEASYNSTFHSGGYGEVQTEMIPEIVKWVIAHPPLLNGEAAVRGEVEAVRLKPKSSITWISPCPRRPN
jgi:hypothetical protein